VVRRSEKILLLVLGTAGLLSLGGVAAGLEPPLLAYSASAAVTAGLLAMLAFGLASLPRSSAGPEPAGPARRLGLGPGRLSPGALLLLAAGTLALSQALDAAIELGGLAERGALADFERAVAGARGLPLAAALAGLGLAPPVGEELFFRGLLQRGLERRLAGSRRGPAAAIALPAALFGLAHIDPIHGGAAFVLGLYLGSVAWLAGGVRAPIACHAVNNVVAVGGSAFDWTPAEPSLAVVAGGLAVAGAALLVALRGVGVPRVVVHAAGQEVSSSQEDPQQGPPQQ